MKNNLILFVFVMGLTNINAQICNHAEKKTKLMTEIISLQDSTQSGILKYYLKLI